VQYANREQRDPFALKNATDCCGTELGQKKYCKNCQAENPASSRKLWKKGKEERLIATESFEQMKDELESREESKVKAVIAKEKLGGDVQDRYGRMLYVTPVDKKEASYKELKEVLGKERTAIGSIVIKGYEYEYLLYVGPDDALRMRLLLSDGQVHSAPRVNLSGVYVSERVVAAYQQLLDKKAGVEQYDFTQFVDSRGKAIEQMVEQAILTGNAAVRARPPVQEMREVKEAEELARVEAELAKLA
jgi:Xaa-Pro aminopeptidase